MDLPFANEVKNELIAAKLLMKESLHPWGSRILTHFSDVEDDLHWDMLPAVTAVVHRSLGLSFRHTVSMTAIFSMLYLSNYIHDAVGDEEEGQEHDRELQFSILIGDYIFGAELKLLSEIDSHYLLPVFAELMCEISEDQVRRKIRGDSETDLEMLVRGKTSLYRTAFLVAAVSAGISERERALYREMGHNLGMAVSLIARGHSNNSVYPYLEKAKALRLLTGGERCRDKHLLDMLLEGLAVDTTNCKVAVV